MPNQIKEETLRERWRKVKTERFGDFCPHDTEETADWWLNEIRKEIGEVIAAAGQTDPDYEASFYATKLRSLLEKLR